MTARVRFVAGDLLEQRFNHAVFVPAINRADVTPHAIDERGRGFILAPIRKASSIVHIDRNDSATSKKEDHASMPENN